MLMPTTAEAICVISAESTPPKRARVMTMNANSPPCARRIATSTATATLIPNARLATIRMTALSASKATTAASTSPMRVPTTPTSMVIPTVMKNTPINNPLNGAMSISIWWRYSVSDNRRPARKAPSAVESPAAPVAAAIPTTMNSVIAMIRSRLPVCAAKRKIGCST